MQEQNQLHPVVQRAFQALQEADRIIFKQKIEFVEVVTTCETNNRYEVLAEKNGVKQAVMKVKEKTDFCTRFVCGSCRPMKEVRFTCPDPENKANDILFMIMKRDCSCKVCCFVCRDNYEVAMVDENNNFEEPLAKVSQKVNVCMPAFNVYTVDGAQLALKAKNLFCLDFFVPIDKKFILEIGGTEVLIEHKIKLSNLVSDADQFNVYIPQELRNRPDFVNVAATSLVCSFAIDIAYYESSGKSNRGMASYVID